MPTRPRAPTAFVIQRADRVVIVAPFNRDFITDLRRLPFRWRSYDDALHSWTVREPCVEDAVTIASHYFALEFLQPTE